MEKVRVYELAAEFGMDSRQLLAILRRQGEFTRSASSTVEPPVVHNLRDRHAHGTLVTQRQAQPSATAPRPVRNPFTPDRRSGGRSARRPRSGRDDLLAEAAAMFDVDERTLRPQRPSARKPVEQRSRPLSLEDLEWLQLHLSLTAKDIWMDAGLGQADARLALHCIEAGLRPADLASMVNGHSIGYRIKNGEELRSVLALRQRLASA